MKKILIALLILILIATATLFFWKDGRDTITNFFTENNDFGSFFDVDPTSDNDFPPVPPAATSTPVVPGPYEAPVLRQISFEPVSGFTFYATTSTSTRVTSDPERGQVVQEYLATSTAVRFQERATGHVYDVFEFIESPLKVSNITIQKVYTTTFTNNRNDFLMMSASQNNEQVKTTFGRIIPAKAETATASSTEQIVEQKNISSVVNDLAYLPFINKIAYSVKKEIGSEIYTADPQRASEALLTTLPFNEFTIDPLNNTEVMIQTKASATSPGYSYTLNLTTGRLNKIIGDIAGLLTKISPDLKYYLYSQSDQSSPILRGYNTETDVTFRIGIHTIPEKCLFSPKNSALAYCFGSTAYAPALYPDDWYKGRVFNRDNLYTIDFKTGFVESVYVFENDLSFDAYNPQLTFNDESILFENKYDLTLWSIDLEALNNQF